MYVWDTLIDLYHPRQNGRYFADDIFKCVFMNESFAFGYEQAAGQGGGGGGLNEQQHFSIMIFIQIYIKGNHGLKM